MMISIEGESKKVSALRIANAAKFYASKLLSSRLSKNIFLTISIANLRKRDDSGAEIYALCEWEADNVRPREFVITLDKYLSPEKLLTALAHEMVHLKQYAKCELKELYRPKCVKWRGAIYDVESPNFDYWFCPWELQAYGAEKGLYYKFLDYEDSNYTKKTIKIEL